MLDQQHSLRLRRRVGRGQGRAEQSVRPQTRLVRRAVELTQDSVDLLLVAGFQSPQGVRNRSIDVDDRAEHALAGEPLGIAVA